MTNSYIWTPAGTDITVRWRMQGWVPPSELDEYRRKWKYFQELPMRRLDDKGKAYYEEILERAKVKRIR
jgi:hypothetical protein